MTNIYSELENEALNDLEMPAFLRRRAVQQKDYTLLRVVAGTHFPTRDEVVSAISHYLKDAYPVDAATLAARPRHSTGEILRFSALEYMGAFASINHVEDVFPLIDRALAKTPLTREALDQLAKDQSAEWHQDRLDDPPVYGAYPSPYSDVTTKEYLKNGVSVEVGKWKPVMLRAQELKDALHHLIQESDYIGEPPRPAANNFPRFERFPKPEDHQG